LFYFYACQNEPKEIKREFIHSILDSIQADSLITVFLEDEAISIIKEDAKQTNLFLKITYRETYPAFVDTLERVAKNKFHSKRFKLDYAIENGLINIHYVESMVHPCYTWQGQAPVQRLIEKKYKQINYKND
jgi:hypothetical protein